MTVRGRSNSVALVGGVGKAFGAYRCRRSRRFLESKSTFDAPNLEKLVYNWDGFDYNPMTTLNSEKLAALAKDLTKDYPRSPRELLAGYIIGMRTLDKCRAALNNSLGEYHFDCPVDAMFFEFTGTTADQFKDFVATGANDQEVAEWVQKHAKPRERIEIIKWNNGLRYKRLSEMDDGIQEYMEDYIPQFVPKHLQHHIDYFFDIYDAEEKRMET